MCLEHKRMCMCMYVSMQSRQVCSCFGRLRHLELLWMHRLLSWHAMATTYFYSAFSVPLCSVYDLLLMGCHTFEHAVAGTPHLLSAVLVQGLHRGMRCFLAMR